MKKLKSMDYRSSGVDIRRADALVSKIAGIAAGTQGRKSRAKVRSAVGGYASLVEVSRSLYIAASTDGVGTKLKLAFESQNHRTVGIDLVAMSVNDLLCVGALPAFFLDYFATGELKPEVAQQVIQGIATGCAQAGCALVGGETAEMPGFYAEGEYDLAGFAVGWLKPKNVLPKPGKIKVGDVLIGLRSSGFHSNGYSLLRRLPGASEAKRRKQLLEPTRIYVDALAPLIEKNLLNGAAHITGSGLLNIPRMSERVSYEIELPPLSDLPDVFRWAKEGSGLGLSAFARTFNCGIGMVLCVSPTKVAQVERILRARGESPVRLGATIRRRAKQSSVVVFAWGEQAEIRE